MLYVLPPSSVLCVCARARVSMCVCVCACARVHLPVPVCLCASVCSAPGPRPAGVPTQSAATSKQSVGCAHPRRRTATGSQVTTAPRPSPAAGTRTTRRSAWRPWPSRASPPPPHPRVRERWPPGRKRPHSPPSTARAPTLRPVGLTAHRTPIQPAPAAIFLAACARFPTAHTWCACACECRWQQAPPPFDLDAGHRRRRPAPKPDVATSLCGGGDRGPCHTVADVARSPGVGACACACACAAVLVLVLVLAGDVGDWHAERDVANSGPAQSAQRRQRHVHRDRYAKRCAPACHTPAAWKGRAKKSVWCVPPCRHSAPTTGAAEA